MQIFKLDIIRNICVKEKVTKEKDATDDPLKTVKRCKSFPNLLFHHKKDANKDNAAKKLANIEMKKEQENADEPEADQQQHEPEADPENGEMKNDDDEDQIECAISGKLEIRVIPKEVSPNPEESVYFDAVTNGAKSAESKSLHDLSISNRNKYQDVKQFFEDNFAPPPPPTPPHPAQVTSLTKIIPLEDDKWIRFDENGLERKLDAKPPRGGAISKIFKEPIPPLDLDDEQEDEKLFKNTHQLNDKENQLFCDIKNILNENINNNNNHNTKNNNNIISNSTINNNFNNFSHNLNLNNNFSPLSDKLLKVDCDDPSNDDNDPECGITIEKLLLKNNSKTINTSSNITATITTSNTKDTNNIIAATTATADQINPTGKSSEQISVIQHNLAMKKDFCSNLNSSSKIPILSSNLRLSKCASWSGNENPDLADLTPGKDS